MPRIDEAKRREWLRALRRFKYGIKVRAKLGVLQIICEQVAEERRGQLQWDCPDWEHENWVHRLYECIRDNEYPTVILQGFAKSAEITFFNPNKQPSPKSVLRAVDNICNQLSRRLRTKFGVFK